MTATTAPPLKNMINGPLLVSQEWIQTQHCTAGIGVFDMAHAKAHARQVTVNFRDDNWSEKLGERQPASQ